MSDSDIAPRAAFQTHMDGDPKPRPDEVERFDAVRREHELEEMFVCIVTEDAEAGEDALFPGRKLNWWSLTDAGLEPTEVDLQITDAVDVPRGLGGGKHADD